MVNPKRPQFVLFGSSIVQFSFAWEGWGASIATIYGRKADTFLRGYAGWNSRQAVEVLDLVFPKDEEVQPALIIVYFGGNDAALPGHNSHIPIPEYLENMAKLITHLKGLSEQTRLIFLTAPPVNEQQMLQVLGAINHTNDLRQAYADALEGLCNEMGVKSINLCNEFKRHPEWMETFFTDGMHLTALGSRRLAVEILKVIKHADWKPSLYWEDMPTEFPATRPII